MAYPDVNLDDPSSFIAGGATPRTSVGRSHRLLRKRRANKGKPPITVDVLAVTRKALEVKDRRRTLAASALEVLAKVSHREALELIDEPLEAVLGAVSKARKNLNPMYVSLNGELRFHPGCSRALKRFVLAGARR